MGFVKRKDQSLANARIGIRLKNGDGPLWFEW